MRLVETFGYPTLCALSIFTFSNPMWFENVSLSNYSVSFNLSFSYSSSPSVQMLSWRDRFSRSLGVSQSSWLSCHTFSKSVWFFSFSNSIVFQDYLTCLHKRLEKHLESRLSFKSSGSLRISFNLLLLWLEVLFYQAFDSVRRYNWTVFWLVLLPVLWSSLGINLSHFS